MFKLFGTVGVIVIAAFLFVFVRGCSQTYTTRPELSLAVKGPDGPVTATVHVISWSHPHSRLDHREQFETDSAGQLTLTRAEAEERVYPLCMHGVPAHHLSLCIEAPDFQDVVIELGAGVEPEMSIRLMPGESGGKCDKDVPRP